ncbi:hypothetical protein [Streptomyces sp. CBMA123]|uniref:hypothetical protein n=1 Tax=Streptomyces sp. CBMA123 TaxID=1896313 RepID=UPI001661E6D1|nr:hypothetical protein [Streptomyces sp. CBMA123]MBD0692486.1 hypothetical protein [Streptomyces sp. CBMA123]
MSLHSPPTETPTATTAPGRTDTSDTNVQTLGIDDFMLVHTSEQWIDPYFDDGVDQWEVGIYTKWDGCPDARVGGIRITMVDTTDCANPVAALDEISEDLFNVAKALYDEAEPGSLRSDLDEQLALPYGKIIIVDEVKLDRRLRGHGLGVFLTGMALKHLNHGTGLFALFPGPLERDDTPYEQAVERLGRAWSRIGFEPYRDGTWILDPGLVTLHRAIQDEYQRLADHSWCFTFQYNPDNTGSDIIDITTIGGPADLTLPEANSGG